MDGYTRSLVSTATGPGPPVNSLLTTSTYLPGPNRLGVNVAGCTGLLAVSKTYLHRHGSPDRQQKLVSRILESGMGFHLLRSAEIHDENSRNPQNPQNPKVDLADVPSTYVTE